MINIFNLRRVFPAFFYIAAALGGGLAFAQEGELSGYLGLEGRYFLNEPLYPEQEEHSGSVSAYLEYYRDFKDGDQRFAFTGFARADSADDQRSHGDIRELYWWQDFSSFQVYAGLRKVFWGVAESEHLVDIINQDDLVENLSREEKLGQPMVQIVTSQDWGVLEGFILPYFREKEYPGEGGRLRFPLPISDDAIYTASDEEQHTDFALRWSHYFGPWDFDLSHFTGTSRDPRFVLAQQGANAVLVPLYFQVDQSGLAIQATIDAWLWKAEMASIKEDGYGRNSAFIGGLEYSFYTVANTNADLGLILEYQFDDRRGERQVTTQNDVVLGARWAFNDLDGSEILVLAAYDFDYGNQFYSLEMSRRLTESIKLELETRLFTNTDEESFEYVIRDDDYVQAELRWYF